MKLVLFSLGLSLIITTIGIFFDEDKKSNDTTPDEEGKKSKFIFNKSSLTTKNILLFAVNVAALVVSYIMIQTEANENDDLKKNISQSKSLLNEANEKLNNQQAQIFSGFEKLKKQLDRQGSKTNAISNSISELTENIEAYSSSSKNLMSSLNRSLTIKDVGTKAKLIPEFSIPVGEKSALTIDGKNQIAVYSETSRYSYFILNGKRQKLYPAQEILFIDENGIEQILVYHGVINEKHNFTIKSK